MTFGSTIQTARPTRSGTRGSAAMLVLASVAVVLLALPAAAPAGQGSTLAGEQRTTGPQDTGARTAARAGEQRTTAPQDTGARTAARAGEQRTTGPQDT